MLGDVLHDAEVVLHGVGHPGDEAELGDQDDLDGFRQIGPLELEREWTHVLEKLCNEDIFGLRSYWSSIGQ